jgi:hypothetical protein
LPIAHFRFCWITEKNLYLFGKIAADASFFLFQLQNESLPFFGRVKRVSGTSKMRDEYLACRFLGQYPPDRFHSPPQSGGLGLSKKDT